MIKKSEQKSVYSKNKKSQVKDVFSSFVQGFPLSEIVSGMQYAFIITFMKSTISIATAIVWNSHFIIFSFRARFISRRNFLKPTYHSFP